MDSFFSLFDPSDGQKSNKKQKPDDDNDKKKSDAPKGRRRGRKCVGKQEPLPEESSFLCEPQLSGEVLVHGGYIDSYIALPRGGDDRGTKTDIDNKPKRRNSGRKNRRKKNRVSPFKDIQPNNGWKNENESKSQEIDIQTQEFLNNKFKKTGNYNEAIGKNVNNLTDFKKNKRKNSLDDLRDSLEQLSVYNAVDSETMGIRHDLYLSGDDAHYRDDSRSESDETDDSSDETYGSLPPEPRFGNVEYKLQLVAPGERRFQHLVTQLKWRLRSGGGSAVYVVGVRDCGALVGLSARALRASLHTLRRMAGALGATLAHCTARKLAPHRALAEVYIRKLADTQQSIELRVAVLGANEAGKSTLIGVLTQGELDNGRGSARLNMFRHVHEVRSGRTSSLSHEILGFDAQGNVVNYGCSELMTAERIGERSAKLVSFLDLAGHTKYQRTTLHGLSGYSPHYAMLVISATAGITSITEEHLALLLALDLPFFTVISKSELAANSVPQLLVHLADILQHHSKKPVLITDENAARSCVAPKKLIIDTIHGEEKADDDDYDIIPVFPVSCVRGFGINALHAYLLSVQPPADSGARDSRQETCEFQIDEVFHVGDSSGPVVGGLVTHGELHEGDQLIIGPLNTGTFVPVVVTSVYRNRAPHRSARAGQAASLCVRAAGAGALRLRPGMVLLAGGRGGGDRPVFGGCAVCAHQLPIPQKDEYPSRKNARRKNKNLLQDIAKVQNSLIKDEHIKNTNIYTEESEKDNMNSNAIEQDGKIRNVFDDNKDGDIVKREGCTCDGKVFLEDPNDPRGCIYFQASIHVLRHPTAICPGFQCTVHVGNVRQTAIIEGIMSHNKELRAGEGASVVFRFVRCPEYLVTDRRLLLTAGLGTRAIGRVTQVFPYIP